MRNGQSLLIKANRMFGARLVENNIIDLEDLENANTHFLDKLRSGNLNEASILKLLVYELKSLNEDDLINYQIEKLGLGYCDLDNYKINEDIISTINIEDCRSTWSLPIDSIAGFWFVSSAYYLSIAVRKFWEESLNGDIIWYVSDFPRLNAKIESLENIKEHPAVEQELQVEGEEEEEALETAVTSN